MPDMWLWYSFLRTGRADILSHGRGHDPPHAARSIAITSAHLPAGLDGTTCSTGATVRKSCASPERCSKRPYYYLTTDERTGDLMNEVIDADETLRRVDPMARSRAGQDSEYPTPRARRAGLVCDVRKLAGRLGRTGDTKYRDRIVTGMKCMAAMPHQLFSGLSYGYDPKTKMLYQDSRRGRCADAGCADGRARSDDGDHAV